MLFIPGNNPGMIQNATVFGADSIIFDLEDAVNIDEKDAARTLVSNAIRTFEFYPTECVVRINPMDTVWGEVDLRRIAQCEPDAILLPKADIKSVQECVMILDEMEELMQLQRGNIKIIVLIESAIGVEMASEIINLSSRIEAVLLGAEDLTADMGVSRTLTGKEILYARTRLAVLCKAYNLQFIDTPFVDVNNSEGLIEDIKEAVNLGATGKAAINPRQVEMIHKGFMPSELEVKWAKEVIKGWEVASQKGIGVFSLNGKMVDLPVKLRADSILHKVTMI
jgi:citrate lyase subunit beta/citryl-CoA lyase